MVLPSPGSSPEPSDLVHSLVPGAMGFLVVWF